MSVKYEKQAKKSDRFSKIAQTKRTKIMKETQEKQILDILEKKQYAYVDDLSAALRVSPSTTRRLLETLTKQGVTCKNARRRENHRREQYFAEFYLPYPLEFF